MNLNIDPTLKCESIEKLKKCIQITRGKEGIVAISFKSTPVYSDTTDTLIKEAHDQIMAYLKRERTVLDFPIEIKGTAFQKEVYETILNIPYAEVWTYKEVARQMGRPDAQRAVGGALNKNPLSLIVPCHRVVGSNGKLVGFGSGLSIKKALLKLEGII